MSSFTFLKGVWTNLIWKQTRCKNHAVSAPPLNSFQAKISKSSEWFGLSSYMNYEIMIHDWVKTPVAWMIIDGAQQHVYNYKNCHDIQKLQCRRPTISFTATSRSFRASANRFNWPPIIWNNKASSVNESAMPGLCTLTATSSPECRWAENLKHKRKHLARVYITYIDASFIHQSWESTRYIIYLNRRSQIDE